MQGPESEIKYLDGMIKDLEMSLENMPKRIEELKRTLGEKNSFKNNL